MVAVRAQVIEAVEQLGLRVTVGEVAAHTGLSLTHARQQIQGLAQTAEGHLQVSSGGDIVYAFQPSFRNILAQRARQSKLEVFRQRLWQGFLYGLRISFGVVLLVSIALAIAAITILIIASSRDRDRRSGGGSSRRYSGGGGTSFYGGGFYIPNLWIGNPFFRPMRSFRRGSLYRRTDIGGHLGYPKPIRSRQQLGEPEKLNFLEAVYSVLFGDGNPNEDIEDRQDSAIASRIAKNGGVVAAEEVLPYLQSSPDRLSEYEDFMLPVLVKYDGFPKVSDRGELVYHFPQLQVTTERAVSRFIPETLEEQAWGFTMATASQRTTVLALGVVNFLLWAMLQSYAGTLADILALPVGLVAGVFGLLALYGGAFLVVPLVRWFTLQKRNRMIEIRNQQRQDWSRQLQSPSEALRHKQEFARQFARMEILEEDEAIYRSDREVIEQRDYRLDSPEFRSLND